MHGTCCVQAADIPDGAELFISSGEPFKPEGQSAHTVAICVPASLHPCAPALVGPTLPIRPALCTHPVALSSPKRCSFVRLCMRLCVHAITLVCMRSRLCACARAPAVAASIGRHAGREGTLGPAERKSCTGGTTVNEAR
jgi:hypothetical protein